MIELYLMRHAQSEINAVAVPGHDRRIGGCAPAVPLTKLGIEQAQAAGEELARAKIRLDEIFLLYRCLRTPDLGKRACSSPCVEQHASVLQRTN